MQEASPCGAIRAASRIRLSPCMHPAGAAASQLLEAAKLARQSIAGPDSLQPAWKLLGDILLQFSAVSPVLQAGDGADGRDAEGHTRRWVLLCLLRQHLMQRGHRQTSASAVP